MVTNSSPGDTPRMVGRRSKIVTDVHQGHGAPGSALAHYGQQKFLNDFRADPYLALKTLSDHVGEKLPDKGTEEKEEFDHWASYLIGLIFAQCIDATNVLRWIDETRKAKTKSALLDVLVVYEDRLRSMEQ